MRVSFGSALPATAAASPAAPTCKRFSVTLGESRPPSPPATPLPTGPLSPPAETPATRLLGRLLEDQKAVDRGLARALRGAPMSPRQLIALQVDVIRYSQELEVASRLVEKVTGAVKQTMQTQV